MWKRRADVLAWKIIVNKTPHLKRFGVQHIFNPFIIDYRRGLGCCGELINVAHKLCRRLWFRSHDCLNRWLDARFALLHRILHMRLLALIQLNLYEIASTFSLMTACLVLLLSGEQDISPPDRWWRWTRLNMMAGAYHRFAYWFSLQMGIL